MSYSLFNSPKASAFFEYVGLVVVSLALVRTAFRIFNNLGSFYLGLGSVNLKKYGSWAVVTGCTDGIGKAYAEKLAKHGVNLVLISRTISKLEEQAKQLTEKYGIHTKVIAADFTEADSIYPRIKAEISDLDIGLLVNNVGVSYSYPEYFDTFAVAKPNNINDMINCNIISLTKMTALVLPGMLKKQRGIIINNASASGRVPAPLLAVYSASKAYVDFFSRALAVEYKAKGIIVQSLCPYFVSTKLSAIRKSFTAPLPNEYVSSALKTIASQPITNGCLIHNLQGWLFEEVIPRGYLNQIQLKHLSIARSKALAKIKRQQAEAKTE